MLLIQFLGVMVRYVSRYGLYVRAASQQASPRCAVTSLPSWQGFCYRATKRVGPILKYWTGVRGKIACLAFISHVFFYVCEIQNRNHLTYLVFH